MPLTVPTEKQAETAATITPLLAQRWSPYVFAAKPVTAEDLLALFEAARWTASSYNEQPWRYVVARRDANPELHAAIVKTLAAGNQPWAAEAPVLAVGIISTTFKRNDKPNKSALHDLGAASAQLTIEATSRGLAVHQMIGIDPDAAKTALGVPDGFEVYTALAIGYPGNAAASDAPYADRDQKPRSRQPLSAFVFSSWDTPARFIN